MRHTHAVLFVVAGTLAADARPGRADDAIINTPVVIATLKGDWELQPKGEGEYRQRHSFDGSRCGEWHRSKAALPVSTTFYVEGNELMIQYYHEPNGAFNYRLMQDRYGYKLDGDTLTLTRGGMSQVWKRVAGPGKQ